jgi:hypothetical protein
VTIDPSTIDLAILNVSGRSGVATDTMEKLNGVGFAVTEDDLLAPEQGNQDGITVAYDPADPANLTAALTVAAAVPGATLVPTDGLGSQIQLLLGASFDGTVQSVPVGSTVTGTVAEPISGSPTGASTTASLSSGELESVNAGEALCA